VALKRAWKPIMSWARCTACRGRTLRHLTVSLVAGGCLLASPGGASSPVAGATGASAPAAGPSLLLVTIDTLRADHLASYGYEAVETPHLDRLARGGVRFDQVATTAPLTLPAHASIFSGQYPHHHGVRDNLNFPLAGETTTLAEVLRAVGFATGGFYGASVLDLRTGLGRGFETYLGPAGGGSVTPAQPTLQVERRGEAVVADALPWIAAQSGRFFAWVHLFDPHAPYSPPAPFLERYAGRGYDGEVAYSDHVVGSLMAGLEALGRAADTIVVVAADHGEGLGDHGEQFHSALIYDSTVRVPLILWAPERLPAGRVVGGQASVVDLLPTTLALLGVEDPQADRRDGADLRPLINAPDAPGRPAYVESLTPFLQLGWGELRALRTADFKYIAAPRPELYGLRADAGESDDLIDREPRRAADLAARLAEIVGGDDVDDMVPGGGFVDVGGEARLRELQALGYVTVTATTSGAIRKDPKDHVELLEAFQRDALAVERALATRRWQDADAIIERLAARLPGHPMINYYRGRSSLRQGRAAAAVADLEETLALAPANALAWLDLGEAYWLLGDRKQACEVLGEAAEAFPAVAAFPLRLGTYLQEDGRLDEAERAFVAARRLAPRHPTVLRRLANVYLGRAALAEAREVLAELVQIEPRDPSSWSVLAQILCRLDEAAQCEAALRQAIASAPDRADPYFNLGAFLLREGAQTEAAELLREALRREPGHRGAREALSRIVFYDR
jgi:arylsulfatase A-like enzyme/Tfp pilus assembly protein PilF